MTDKIATCYACGEVFDVPKHKGRPSIIQLCYMCKQMKGTRTVREFIDHAIRIHLNTLRKPD